MQRPPVHGIPLQQSPPVVHSCPYSEQPASIVEPLLLPLPLLPLPLPLPLPLLPPLLPLPLPLPLLLLLLDPQGPQVPLMHADPGQQSALLLQPPHEGTHFVSEHT